MTVPGIICSWPLRDTGAFTVKEFAKEVHIRASLAQVVLQILAYAGVVERVGKKGNAYLYKVLEGDE